MRIYYLVLFLIAFTGILHLNRSVIQAFSKEFCDLIKGVCAILIVLTHLKVCPHYIFSKEIVAIFYFISGYGLMNSMLVKKNYLESFVKYRLSAVILPFVVVMILYQVVFTIDGNNFDFYKLICDIACGNLPLPYSWFVVSILFFYISFYLVFKYINSWKYAQLALLCVVLMYIWSTFIFHWGVWWRISSLAFNLGVFWRYKEDILMEYLAKYKLVLVIVPVFMLLLYISLPSYFSWGENPVSYAFCLFFPVIIVFLTYRWGRYRNKYLSFLGDISYEIYILQGVFIYILRGNHIYISSQIVYVISVLVSTVIVAYLLHRVLSLILVQIKKSR